MNVVVSRALWIVTAVVTAIAIGCPVAAFGDDSDVDFDSQIAPILSHRCVSCHSPGINKGGLSLATINDALDAGYIVPGQPDDSHLVDLISSVDGEPPEMPGDGDPLSDEQVQLIRGWIAAGARWPEQTVVREASKADASWWSLQPLAKSNMTSIDLFIDAKLASVGLSRNPPADRATLIRRATYDLTGLPPTPEEIRLFVADPDPGAYAKLIDRLLQSPAYGQRWGRHWLDVVRFGESNGFERNQIIDQLWPFRDFVIDSINQDKPFDQFIREHLAGDAMPDSGASVGSAFLVAGPYDDVGNQDAAQAAQIRANTLDEMIRATGQAFLGMTIGCARCHDHKFDPITQEDYYGLYATFAGVRHGAVPLATDRERQQRAAAQSPIRSRRNQAEKRLTKLKQDILDRANNRLAHHQESWTRPAVDRRRTEDRFKPTMAKFVRLVCQSQDARPQATSGFTIDEFEVWSSPDDDAPTPINVALASAGAIASGAARRIQDFPGAYGPHLVNDGKLDARFLAASDRLTIELPDPIRIDRVVFSSARAEQKPDHQKFVFVAEYTIEVSLDGKDWRAVSSSRDRRPIDDPRFRDLRLTGLETLPEEAETIESLQREIRRLDRELAAIKPLPLVWIGRRVESDAKGPFHTFVGGSPQRLGSPVYPHSLTALRSVAPEYSLDADAGESDRRLALANWITDDRNPVTPRVLANRVWHYHFGTGLVDTPNDFGYMGGRPTHPELLDFLASELIRHRWRLKPLHRSIMLSQTYCQSSEHRDQAARIDHDARWLWRFPPRRLSAEEIRDTMLSVAGVLTTSHGGPGFRLYQFMQDNVCTYVPLDQHGPETYRRSVYHQNARASVVDLMTEFDQPDCTFSTAKRDETTTPLQALTMMNHSFTIDMATSLADRLGREVGGDDAAKVKRLVWLAYGRDARAEEIETLTAWANQYGWPELCRVLLNTSELIHVR